MTSPLPKPSIADGSGTSAARRVTRAGDGTAAASDHTAKSCSAVRVEGVAGTAGTTVATGATVAAGATGGVGSTGAEIVGVAATATASSAVEEEFDVEPDCWETGSSDFGDTVCAVEPSPDDWYRVEVKAPPELRITTPGPGSPIVFVVPDGPGPDVSSDPGPGATDPAPADGVDPSDDTIPESAFGSGPPRAESPTADVSEEDSAVGSAEPRPGKATAADHRPNDTARAPTRAMRFESLTARAPCRCPF
jgi:hypothetical protein